MWSIPYKNYTQLTEEAQAPVLKMLPTEDETIARIQAVLPKES